MPLTDVRIDEALWQAATAERRREWRQIVHDLLADHRFGDGVPQRLTIRLVGGDTVLEAAPDAGGPSLRLTLPLGTMMPHFQGYFAICRDMSAARPPAPAPRLEALDIAKRLSHDEAADVLLALCEPLGVDHPTCRRLFTLLLCLHFDTSTLLVAHHRGH